MSWLVQGMRGIVRARDVTRLEPEAHQPILETTGDLGMAALQWGRDLMSGLALRWSAWQRSCRTSTAA